MTRSLSILLAASMLAGCSTMTMPDVGAQLSEFRQTMDGEDFMSSDELPPVPTDMRSDAEWDAAAREMLALRDGFDAPVEAEPVDDAAFEREFQQAQEYTNAYTEDDPQ